MVERSERSGYWCCEPEILPEAGCNRTPGCESEVLPDAIHLWRGFGTGWVPLGRGTLLAQFSARRDQFLQQVVANALTDVRVVQHASQAVAEQLAGPVGVLGKS